MSTVKLCVGQTRILRWAVVDGFTAEHLHQTMAPCLARCLPQIVNSNQSLVTSCVYLARISRYGSVAAGWQSAGRRRLLSQSASNQRALQRLVLVASDTRVGLMTQLGVNMLGILHMRVWVARVCLAVPGNVS